jgi:hypothetical protein
MKATWGMDHTDFQNMCPFFWFTLISVVFAPIIWLGLGIAHFFLYIKESGNASKINNFKAFSKKLLEELKDDEKMREFARIDLYKDKNEKYWDFYSEYIIHDDELFTRYLKFKKEVESEFERLAKEDAERKREKKARLDRLYRNLSWLKPVGRIILFAIIGTILYLSYKGIYYLWAHYNFDMEVMKGLGIALGGCLIGLTIIVTIDHFTKNVPKEKFKYLLYPLYPLFWLFEGIWIIIKFLWEVLYKKNCPGIKWK